MIVNWDRHSGESVAQSGSVHVIHCTTCGFKHIVPIPGAEQVQQFYIHHYHGSDISRAVRKMQEDAEWLNLMYHDRFDLFEQMLPPGRRRLLDIGSGIGAFLLCGAERGWEVWGVEPSLSASEYARSKGLNVVQGFYDGKMAERLGIFDVVHLDHVLEHIPNPIQVLEWIRDSLSPGGVLFLTVPNDFNPFQKALVETCGYRHWWVVPKHHINYFDFETLPALLERHGFEVVAEETSFPMELFLLMGINYVDEPQRGRECHEKRKRLEITLNKAGYNDVRRKLLRCFAQNGLGRDVVVYARKP
ncbi:MAG TPA: class I SAM-dependent methyltransferase [Paenibacillaceae bacterium]